MNIEEIGSIIIWIMPGFITIKVWSMLIATQRKKASEIIIECIIVSFFNYVFYRIISLILVKEDVIQNVCLLIFIFCTPIIWPIIFKKIIECKYISDRIIDPTPKAWDKLFSRGEIMFVLIHMQDGKKIGGLYAEKSYTSSYPEEEDIYIEKVWRLRKKNEEGNIFKEEISGSNGVWIARTEIKYIEFFKAKGGEWSE